MILNGRFMSSCSEAESRKYPPGLSGRNGSQIHSLRLPGYIIGAEIIFGAADQRLSLRYDAGVGAAPYIEGTLPAIRKVKNYAGLVRGLDRIMD